MAGCDLDALASTLMAMTDCVYSIAIPLDDTAAVASQLIFHF